MTRGRARLVVVEESAKKLDSQGASEVSANTLAISLAGAPHRQGKWPDLRLLSAR